MAEYSSVREWLDLVRERMMWIFARSNLYQSLHAAWTTLGVYGTPAVGIFEDYDRVLRTQVYPVGSYYLATDHHGRVNTFYRDFKLSVKQLVDKFGDKVVSQPVKDLYARGNYDVQIDVVHLIEPNDDRDPNVRNNRNMPFRSVYYELNSKNEEKLYQGGFEQFQILAPRWSVNGQNVYGDSPGMDLLGDVKQLQAEEINKAMGVEKMVDPPLSAPSSLEHKLVSNYPGGVTYHDVASGFEGVRTLYDTRLPINEVRQDIREIEQRISEGFFEDLFLMLAHSDRRQITAREIEERHQEKLLMLGPVLDRLHDEALRPLIDLTFDIMVRNNLVPPPPPELEDMNYEVEYISILAQAQRLIETSTIGDTAAFVGSLIEAFPTAADKFDADQAIDEFHDSIGAPASIIRSDDEVAAIRQQRQQAQQQQQAIEAMNQAAQGAKLLSETETNPDNLLGQLFGP